jgi:hypothetical protein
MATDPKSPKPANPAKAKRPSKGRAVGAAVGRAAHQVEYVVLHRLHHNAQELEPGALVTFHPWPTKTEFVGGKVVQVMSTPEEMSAHIGELLKNGVIAPHDGKAKDALAAADKAREVAATKAG